MLGRGWGVEKAEDLKPAVAAAAEHAGPALVDIIAQPLQEARAPVSEWVA
jgi:acetolactate synthase-1/2/3 large subunit